MRIDEFRHGFRNCLAALVIVLSAFYSFAAGPGCDGAGNCFVRAGAKGTGNGSSWTNACTGFTGTCSPSNLSRGATYWISAGSYGSVNFNTPDGNANAAITITAATVSSHGSAADWNNTFAGQAIFHDLSFMSDNWVLDGQSRGSDWISGYNIKVTNSGSSAEIIIGNIGGTQGSNNIRLQYIEASGPSGSDEGIQLVNNSTNDYIGYSYIHDNGDTEITTGPSSGGFGDGLTIEYCWLARNNLAGGGQHSEIFDVTSSDVIIRFNVLEDGVSTAIFANATGANTNPVKNLDFYGNIVFWDPAFSQKPTSYLGDGLVHFLDGTVLSGTIRVLNNTIYNIQNPNAAGAACAGTLYSSNTGQGTATVLVYNNILYNSCPSATASGAGVTAGFNAYGGSFNSGGVGITSGANDNNNKQTLTSDPFLNPSSNTIAGFALKSDTQAGFSNLPAPDNVDLNGVLRAADGVWDRGALQLSGSRPSPPTNLTAKPR